MDAGRCAASLERHATSKIRTRRRSRPPSLTLGFRGEALPSIASVSHFTLRTRARGATSGTEIRVNAGAIEPVARSARPRARSIEVADLFYNLPARRKFLKSDAAESAQVSQHRDAARALLSGGRLHADQRRARGAAVPAGRDRSRTGCLPDLRRPARPGRGAARGARGMRLTASSRRSPSRGRRAGPQHVFVNRRIVQRQDHRARDPRRLQRRRRSRSAAPRCTCSSTMPPDRVDVNVHPTKAEVRFVEQSLVHEVVRRGVADALGRGADAGAAAAASAPIARRRAGVGSASLPMLVRPSRAGARRLPARGGVDGAPERPGFARHDGRTGRATAPRRRASTWLRPLMPLGQFRDTFIIAVDDDGIAIVDQHVAHERVLFERIIERLTERRAREPADCWCRWCSTWPGAAARHAAVARAGDLARFGFDVEDFGGDSRAGHGDPGAARRATTCEPRAAGAGQRPRGRRSRPRRRARR